MESIIASLIVAVAISGLISLWVGADLSIRDTAEVNQAGQIARAELELAKTYGPANFPEGTLTCSTGDGAVWTGAFNPSTGSWTSGGTAYYDYQGNWQSTSSGANFSLQITVTDSGDLPPSPCSGTTSSYEIANTTKRSAVVTVTRLRDSSVLFTSATEMVIGGV